VKKHIAIMILGLALLVPFTTNAFSSHEGCAGNCIDCHKLEKKEAEEIIKKIAPNGQVTEIKLSPAKGLWQIEVEAGDKRGTLYVDFSKKYLIAGQIVPIDTIGKPAPEIKVDFSQIPLKDAVVFGPKNAKKKVVVFTDPDCPYCRKLHEEMKQVLAKRKDVAFYIFLFPLEMHKDAYKKVQAILCEKSLTLLDDAFSGKPLPEPKCSNEAVEKNKALAKQLQFSGTPTLVREDGMVLSGTRPADVLSNWIDGK
jgi:thiol:disulfide interchange protein DsbC